MIRCKYSSAKFVSNGASIMINDSWLCLVVHITINSHCTISACLKGLYMIQFSGLCVFRVCALLKSCGFKG